MQYKILVVDGNSDTREFLHLYLTQEGFSVSTAADGGQGLYRAKAEGPDLIITDLTMPNLIGTQLIKELRALPEFARTPILTFTA